MTAGLAFLLLLAAQADFAAIERLIGTNDFCGALSALEGTPQPGSARWHLLASKAYDGLNDPERAVREAEAALALDEKSEANHLQLAQIFLARNTPQPAYDVLSDAQRLFPDSLLVRMGRGLASKQLGRSNEAAAELSECLRRKPDWALALDALGGVYLQSSRFAELERVATDYCDRNPEDFRGWYYAAAARSGACIEDAETEKLVRRSIRLNGNFAPSRSLLGKLLASSGQVQEAIAELERAVKLRPGDATLHMRLAYVYQEAGRAADATQQFELGLELKKKGAGIGPRANLPPWQEAALKRRGPDGG